MPTSYFFFSMFFILEVLLSCFIKGKEYDGPKADVWSLGVILYILVTGGFPFPGDNVENLKRAVLSCQMKIPYWVSVGTCFVL